MQPPRLALAAALPLLAPAAAAQRALFESHPTGDLDYLNYGYALARAGDLDGDGREDFWMGGPDAYDDFGFVPGRVYLSSGMVVAQSILPPPPACTSTQIAYVLAAGVEAKFLGKEFDLGREAVVDKRWDYTVPQTAQRQPELR